MCWEARVSLFFIFCSVPPSYVLSYYELCLANNLNRWPLLIRTTAARIYSLGGGKIILIRYQLGEPYGHFSSAFWLRRFGDHVVHLFYRESYSRDKLWRESKYCKSMIGLCFRSLTPAYSDYNTHSRHRILYSPFFTHDHRPGLPEV